MRLNTVARLTVAIACSAFVLTACGGSDKPGPSTPTALATQAVSTRSAIHDINLSRSSNAAANATSFTATFHADVQTDQQSVSEDGTMIFEAPSNFDMKLSVGGAQTEVLLRLPDEYINIAGRGWYSVGADIINRDAYQQYAKNHGPIDYSGTLNALTNYQQLADEDIDGVGYLHYTGTYDLKTVLDKVPGNILQSGAADLTKAVFQGLKPGSMETWIDRDTELPRRAAIDMAFSIAGKDLSMHMVLDYADWNQHVTLPTAPVDAKSYSELTGGLSPADLAYQLQFSTWLAKFVADAKEFGKLAEAPHDDAARTSARNSAQSLDDDVTAFEALSATQRFQRSHDKFDEALAQLQIVFGEVAKELDSEGGGDTDKVDHAGGEFKTLFADASALYKAESKPDVTPSH